jgi:hypothetical protein
VKIRQVNYNDEQEIETLIVSMSLREAAAIQAIAGKLNGHAEQRLGLEGDDSLYNAISIVFNGHWDEGVPPDGPRLTDLASLNEPL